MKSSKSRVIKNVAVFAAPLLLFVILLIPYHWVNQQFLVEWFGCGCPKVDEFGNIVHSYFNANDFTALFWLFVSICATTLSYFLSKRIPKEKRWFKILYIVGIFAVSILITHLFCQMMMWN